MSQPEFCHEASTDSIPLLSWRVPNRHSILEEESVHIWRCSVNPPPISPVPHIDLLSPSERQRASGYHFAKDRQRFVISRGILRILLGNYLQIPPHSIPIEASQFGKPYLCYRSPNEAIQFNVAHSQNLVLLAFTGGRRVGIDIEFHRDLPDMTALAVQFLPLTQAQRLKQLPFSQQRETFFDYWTRNEAYLKALGVGFANGVHSPCYPGHSGHPTSTWSIWSFTPARHYSATIAIEGKCKFPLTYQYPEAISSSTIE